MNCAVAREAIHARLDGERPAPGLRDHLAGCAACRELEAELRSIQGSLRALPELTFPDEALEEVWRRTIEPGSPRFRRWRGLVAAAAALVLAVGLWQWGGSPAEPSEEELQRAARQARMVLKLTARALHRTERAAIGGVLTDEVSPALRRVPVAWPDASRQRRGDS